MRAERKKHKAGYDQEDEQAFSTKEIVQADNLVEEIDDHSREMHDDTWSRILPLLLFSADIEEQPAHLEEDWDSLKPALIDLKSLKNDVPAGDKLFSLSQKVDLFALPTHCFFGEAEHQLTFTQTIDGEKYRVRWKLVFQPADYQLQFVISKIYFIYLKRQLLEKPEDLPSVLETSDLPAILNLFEDKEITPSIVLEALRQNQSRVISLKIEHYKNGQKRKFEEQFRLFDSCAYLSDQTPPDSSLKNKKRSGFEPIQAVRFKPSNDYLQIMAAAPPIKFDWEYWRKFHPIEIRLHELLGYWRYQDNKNLRERVEVKFLWLSQMVPLPLCADFSEMERLLKTILVNLRNTNWLRQVLIEPPRKGTHLNSKIIFKF